MASLLSQPNFLFLTIPPPTSTYRTHTTLNLRPKTKTTLQQLQFVPPSSTTRRFERLFAVAEQAAVTSLDPKSEAARKLYVGNIPRTVTNDELAQIVQEHGAVEKAEVMYDKYSGRSRRFAFVTMKTVEDANAAVEKLNGTQIGGREIKVNITEKPLTTVDSSLLQADESEFVDSPHKVYVGNLAKTVTSDILKNFFSEKGKVLSAKVSRVPGTSKSSGFGFVSFSSDEDVEAAISSFNNAFSLSRWCFTSLLDDSFHLFLARALCVCVACYLWRIHRHCDGRRSTCNQMGKPRMHCDDIFSGYEVIRKIHVVDFKRSGGGDGAFQTFHKEEVASKTSGVALVLALTRANQADPIVP